MSAEEQLELAWIELQYAGADFANSDLSAADEVDIETIVSRLRAAKLAVQIAISALANESEFRAETRGSRWDG